MRDRARMGHMTRLLPIVLLLGACNYAADRPGTAVETRVQASKPTPSISVAPTVEPSPPVSGVPTLDPTRATLQLAVYPPEARTEVEDLNAIIDAVLAHDAVALRGLSSFVEAPCTHADGLGGPPKCGPDEVEGTIIDVMPFLGPEGHFLRKADFLTWAGPDVLGLLAAYQVSDQAYSDAIYPAGEYAIVFLEADGTSSLTIQVSGGRVVRFDELAGETLQARLKREASEVLLPLANNPIPTPVRWTAFTDPNGRFAFAYPPTWDVASGSGEETWRLGDRV